MNRYALLIGGADLKNSSKADGVEKDLIDVARHLTSNGGGAWENEEIKILLHPTRQQVLDWLKYIEAAAHYATITYAGHGCHYKSPLDETALCLADNEEILVRELNPRTPRHFLILDTCRKLTLVENNDVQKMSRALAASAEGLGSSYRRSCRSKFDTALSECEEGRCIAYACDVNQIAGDSENGGHFTQSMLGHAKVYHGDSTYRTTASAVQTVRENFRLAFSSVQNVNYPQRPILNEGRRIDSLPFAVR